MPKDAPIVLDFREGEQFLQKGSDVKVAIANYLSVWEQELQETASKMAELIGAQSQDSIAALIVALETPEDLSPDAKLINNLAKQAAKAKQEMKELAMIAKNLNDEAVYVLGLADVERYGLGL
jgi:ATP phosphoribosyltransferase regulatory subunit HisZ